MSDWDKTIFGVVIAVLVSVGLPAAAFGQDGGNGGDDDEGPGFTFPDPISPDLPRDNVTGSAVSGRAPGTWIRSAAGRFGQLHGRSINEFGGTDFSQAPAPSRRETFLMAFIPEVFAIINDLIQAYVTAISAGETATG